MYKYALAVEYVRFVSLKKPDCQAKMEIAPSVAKLSAI
jgi:hypothetical protein